MSTLPLTTPRYIPRIAHLDDAGRCLDRARILLDSAASDLLSAAHLVPEAEQLAEEVRRVKKMIVAVWDRLDEPELPFDA